MKTWDNFKCWADMLLPEEKKIVLDALRKAPEERRCPYLKEIVENGATQWIYCEIRHSLSVNAGINEERNIPNLNDPRYIAKVESSALQLFCIDNFRKCINYC